MMEKMKLFKDVVRNQPYPCLKLASASLVMNGAEAVLSTLLRLVGII